MGAANAAKIDGPCYQSLLHKFSPPPSFIGWAGLIGESPIPRRRQGRVEGITPHCPVREKKR